jgi:nicotinate-nucleotide adenylyltransferase
MRIGLYGGSFNPAHAGHRHVSLLVLKHLRLDRIWWIVTPGNPLKDPGELAATAERVAGAGRVAAHPRIDVTSFEEAIGARYTVDTLSFLVRRCPGVDFVWIMGADNLASFHRWRGWETIASLMPMVIVDRPGFTLKAARSRAAIRLAPYRIDEDAAPALATMAPPAWLFLHGPRSPLSSSALRRGCRTSPVNGR